jgi:hypothetical protein
MADVPADDYYGRAAFLVDVMGYIDQVASASGMDLKPEHPAYWTGLRFEVLREMFRVHAQHHKEFAIGSFLGDKVSSLTTAREWGYADSGDPKLDEDMFCLYAMKHGTQRTPALPRFSERIADVEKRGWIRLPVSPARAAEVEKRLGELRAATSAEIAWPGFDFPSFELGETDYDPKWPGVVYVAPSAPIEKVEKVGAHWVATLAAKAREPIEYDCRQTGRIESVDVNGNAHYARECRTGTRETETRYVVTFEDVPDWIGSALKPGDTLVFLAKVTRAALSASTPGPARRAHHAPTTGRSRSTSSSSLGSGVGAGMRRVIRPTLSGPRGTDHLPGAIFTASHGLVATRPTSVSGASSATNVISRVSHVARRPASSARCGASASAIPASAWGAGTHAASGA